jgi:hypothetical protein
LIYCKDGRRAGSFCKINVIKALNVGELELDSGKEYIVSLIFLYVSLTSLDSNGGRPKERV